MDAWISGWMTGWAPAGRGMRRCTSRWVSELARGWTADEEMDGCLMDGGPIRDAGWMSGRWKTDGCEDGSVDGGVTSLWINVWWMGKRVGGKMGEEMQAVWMGGWINSGGITGTNGLAGQGTGQQASGCLDGGWASRPSASEGSSRSIRAPPSLPGKPRTRPTAPLQAASRGAPHCGEQRAKPGRVSGWLTFTAQRGHLLPSDHGPEAPALWASFSPSIQRGEHAALAGRCGVKFKRSCRG